MSKKRKIKIIGPMSEKNYEGLYQLQVGKQTDYQIIAMLMDVDADKMRDFYTAHGAIFACSTPSVDWFDDGLYFRNKENAESAAKEIEAFAVAMRLADFRYAIEMSSC